MDFLGELTDDEDFFELVNNVQNQRLTQTYRERPNHFTKWNDRDFKFRFRLSKQVVRIIIDEIRDDISSKTDRNHALSPEDMVFLTLRFLATGCFLQVTGDFCGVDKSTASRVVHKVTRAIAHLKRSFIKLSEEDLISIRQGFF
ncbi:hypothetical protein NQ314_020130 [Rhamnusium bicolor]|uniref:Nuclease HARBI1 n=1 Tax=Rhamnusium bicolor TaxID=1586634 RepID=A0AAV8WMF2_9CUCU|nr:hypothetical protein NQ314_020130 [Rhamnusium bicolor]